MSEDYDSNQVIYRVDYRHEDGEVWRHYYSDKDKVDALDMYARHISQYGKEQCRLVRTTAGTELYKYTPVYQKETEDE